jgi:hypothetical protein
MVKKVLVRTLADRRWIRVLSVNIYKEEEGGWLGGGPFDPKGNKAVTQRKHTLVLGNCRIVGQSIRGRGTR